MRHCGISETGRALGVAALLLVSFWAGPVEAQGVFEAVGERALGMAGAFVAVADDSTAVHWNPAGLVGGSPVGMTIGWHQFQLGNQDGPAAGPGSRGRTSLTSLGSWPLGVSYGLFDRTGIRADASGPAGYRLRVRHAGVTILQSVLDGLVVGTTVKVLRGNWEDRTVDGTSLTAALEHGTVVAEGGRTALDLDIGVMASAPRVRVGLTLRNLRSPSFRAVAGTWATVPRQARVGLAVLPADGVTLAMDVDLNTVDLLGDLRRMYALGAEARLAARVVVRSGLRWNLAKSSGVTGALGASLGVRRGLWLDAHVATGESGEGREVGAALRAGF